MFGRSDLINAAHEDAVAEVTKPATELSGLVIVIEVEGFATTTKLAPAVFGSGPVKF